MWTKMFSEPNVVAMLSVYGRKYIFAWSIVYHADLKSIALSLPFMWHLGDKFYMRIITIDKFLFLKYQCSGGVLQIAACVCHQHVQAANRNLVADH